jgi:hypothetical protein
MSTPQLLLATLILPGLWGWLIGTCGHRWWRRSERQPPRVDTPPRRLTDYDI